MGLEPFKALLLLSMLIVNNEAPKPHSFSDLLVNLGVVGLQGNPDVFSEALKHLEGPMVLAPSTYSPSSNGLNEEFEKIAVVEYEGLRE